MSSLVDSPDETTLVFGSKRISCLSLASHVGCFAIGSKRIKVLNRS
jgi:hypothetical protein